MVAADGTGGLPADSNGNQNDDGQHRSSADRGAGEEVNECVIESHHNKYGGSRGRDASYDEA